MLENDTPIEIIHLIIKSIPEVRESVIKNFYIAVRSGNRKLAGEIIDLSDEVDGWGFTRLSKEVLSYDSEPLSSFKKKRY